ncbi:RDD family protein [Streptomyces sp. NPDC051636]|uniref:RDD family protein n=1 Tax=Streptomyces sp. NPDC051636 TaxID=3365663 RepID=UPI0037A36ECA
MSAPTPAPGDDRPREGYYPDPSIPGYVRYWNGASWVPGTSRPAPKDGERLAPPPGAGPAQAPAPVEETGPHFFDEDPPAGGSAEPASAWGADRAQQSGFGGDQDRRVSWGADPRVPADSPAQPDGQAARTDGTATIPPADQDSGDLGSGGTFVFRRPAPASGGSVDDGTMTFRPVPRTPAPGQGPGGSGAAGFGVQGPVGAAGAASSGASSGTGFGAGKAAAARAAAAQGEGQAQVPGQAQPQPQGQGQAQIPGQAQGNVPGQAQARPAAQGSGAPQGSVVGPSVPAQAGAPLSGAGPVSATPMTSGPGGGQSSWAQQVHRLAGAGDEQPVAPWKPPVEDPFQAVARRQAAARPAGLGKRLAARLVDTLVLGAVTAAAAVPLGVRAADHVQEKIDAAKLSGRTVTVWLVDGTTGAYLGIVLGVLLLAGVLYEVLPTARWGRTLGKKLCGLQVRDIEAHEPPTFGPALRRWLVYSVPGLLVVGVGGVLWCLFDRPWHQCWHDKAAHTYVAA